MQPAVRRNAVLVAQRPLPTFRVKSRSTDEAYLVVVQRDGSARCHCTAGRFGGRCYHRLRAEASARRRGLVS